MNVIKIIVSDDDPAVNDLISDHLESSGIKVVVKAYDTKDAFQLFNLHKPIVILVHLNMPDYDGNYAITKIKQEHPQLRKLLQSQGF